MALNLTTYFTRLGLLFGRVAEANTFRGATLPAGAAAVLAQFTATDQLVVDGYLPALASAQGALGGWVGTHRARARSLTTQMVAEAAPQPDGSLATALSYVIAGMKAGPTSWA